MAIGADTATLENLTPRARTALILAQSLASRLDQTRITASHVLYGLMRENQGVASQTFRNLGVDPGLVATDLERALESNTELDRDEEVGVVIRQAAEKAGSLSHTYLGQEHLLLAIAEDDQGPAAELLERFLLSPKTVRDEIARVLSAVQPRRYNLALPEDLFREVESIAERDNSSLLEVLRRFIRLGVYLDDLRRAHATRLVIRVGQEERELLWL
jgi:ATP-dependent Clp protease ATP-binding subunit ClpA